MNNSIILLILLGSVLLTGVLVFLFTDLIKSKSKYINTFSAAVVAALIFVHILPEIYEVRSFWIGFSLMIGGTLGYQLYHHSSTVLEDLYGIQ